jgi:hypothetical protein
MNMGVASAADLRPWGRNPPLRPIFLAKQPIAPVGGRKQLLIR